MCALPDMGHHPIIAPRMGKNVPRIDAEIIERLRHVFVPDISDAVGRLYTMDPEIAQFYEPMGRVVGQALTAKCPQGDNLAVHGAFTQTQPGDVLVIDWRGYIDGCGAGASSCVGPIGRGLAGIVVDGGWRDAEEVRPLNLPIFARGRSPFSPAKHEAGEVNVPVSCGGVVVEPGDVIVGDHDGVVVIPRREARHVAFDLPVYTPPMGLKDYDVEKMEKGLVDKEGSYMQFFNARNGEIVDLSGIDS